MRNQLEEMITKQSDRFNYFQPNEAIKSEIIEDLNSKYSGMFKSFKMLTGLSSPKKSPDEMKECKRVRVSVAMFIIKSPHCYRDDHQESDDTCE
jgi:hypothetical protein